MEDFIDPYETDTEKTSFIDPYAEDTTQEETVSQEIDTRKLQLRRDNGEDDGTIMQSILTEAGPNLNINGQSIFLDSALDSGEMSETALLDFLLSGNSVRTDIDSNLKAGVAGVATGLTNFIGLPADLSNMASRGLETLGRKGLNALFKTELSLNPDDYIFSNDNPLGGGQSIRDAGNLFNDQINFMDIPEYVNNPQEVAPEFRAANRVGNIVGENILPVAGLATAAKTGLATGNVLINSIRNNPTRFAVTEAGATTGQAALATVAENTGFGYDDSPYIAMGAEFVGSLIGANPIKVVTGTPGFIYRNSGKILKPIASKIKSRFSEQGGLDAGFEGLLNSADVKRNEFIAEAKLATEAGDTKLAARLTAEADLYLPENMLVSLQEGIARQEALSGGDLNLSVGSISDNPALVAAQKNMMGVSTEFGADVMIRANNAVSIMLELSEHLSRGGNQAAAATLRTRAFSDAINTSLANAKSNATNSLKALEGSNSGAASTLAQKTLFEAKDRMREMETFLWGRIDGTQSVQGTGIRDTYNLIKKKKLLDGMTVAGGGQVDTAIAKFLTRVEEGNVTVKEVLKFRSVMLSNSRKAAGASDFFQAGLFDELASSAADELSVLSGSAGDTVDMARAFSFQLNERFTRQFNKKVLSKEGTGGTTIRDQDVLETGFAGGGRNANTNFFELRRASDDTEMFAEGVATMKANDQAAAAQAKADLDASTLSDDGARVPATQGDNLDLEATDGIMPTDADIIPEVQVTGTGEGEFGNYPMDPANPIPEYTVYGPDASTRKTTAGPSTPEADDFTLNEGGPQPSRSLAEEDVPVNLGEQMSAAQEEFLRAKVLELRDATPLQVGDEVIRSQVLEKFVADNPELIKQFPKLEADIQVMFDAQRISEEMVETLGKAANSEKLPEAIGDALATTTPSESYARLANEAKGLQAMEDFRNATLDDIFRGAINNSGDADILQIANRLFSPVNKTTGGPTILDLMQKNGVLTTKEAEAMAELVAEGIRITKNQTNPAVFDKVLNDTPDLAKNMARLLGANVGVLFGRGNASLQAASIGSGYLNKQISKLPLGSERKGLMKLLKQPKLLASMLENVAPRGLPNRTAREYLLLLKNTSFKDLFKMGALALGDKAVQSAPISTISAVSQSAEIDTAPTLTVDQQMQGAFQ